ncbi:hypothetical protein [Burkholderia ambifaria]|uniref:hypothetical protein n=1 Tax=Burkholderia ambifaria TaxID=152480 RepID=UPI00158B39FE|nr:hypothetical protein [Burkholderia ambifaria]
MNNNGPAWWTATCRTAGASRITNIIKFSKLEKLPDNSPIDHFLIRIGELLKSGTLDVLEANPHLANLYFAGLISYTENYFREIFSRILEVCPTSQAKASSRDVKLGSVMWYRTGKLERSAFEHFSFASSEGIIETCKRFFDITINDKSDCYAVLQEYDRLCELRHGVVHSGGIMSGKNSLKLQLPQTENDTLVFVDFNGFQEAAQICTDLVAAANTDLFRILATRWRDDWPKRVPNWNADMSKARFDQVWQAFYSSRDNEAGLIPTKLTATTCRRAISGTP